MCTAVIVTLCGDFTDVVSGASYKQIAADRSSIRVFLQEEGLIQFSADAFMYRTIRTPEIEQQLRDCGAYCHFG